MILRPPRNHGQIGLRFSKKWRYDTRFGRFDSFSDMLMVCILSCHSSSCVGSLWCIRYESTWWTSCHCILSLIDVCRFLATRWQSVEQSLHRKKRKTFCKFRGLLLLCSTIRLCGVFALQRHVMHHSAPNFSWYALVVQRTDRQGNKTLWQTLWCIAELPSIFQLAYLMICSGCAAKKQARKVCTISGKCHGPPWELQSILQGAEGVAQESVQRGTSSSLVVAIVLLCLQLYVFFSCGCYYIALPAIVPAQCSFWSNEELEWAFK